MLGVISSCCPRHVCTKTHGAEQPSQRCSATSMSSSYSCPTPSTGESPDVVKLAPEHPLCAGARIHLNLTPGQCWERSSSARVQGILKATKLGVTGIRREKIRAAAGLSPALALAGPCLGSSGACSCQESSQLQQRGLLCPALCISPLALPPPWMGHSFASLTQSCLGQNEHDLTEEAAMSYVLRIALFK